MNKLLDLRFVIGIFFVALALLLLGYRFLADGMSDDAKAVNQWCGLAFGLFGIVMVVLSFGKDADDELT